MAENEQDLTLDQRVYLERVRTFAVHAYGAQARMGIGIFFVSLSLYYAATPLLHIGLWGLVLTSILVTLTVLEMQYRHVTLSLENAGLWINLRVGLGIATGATLGASIFLVPSQGHVVPELMITLILVTSVAVTCIGYITMPAYYIALSISSVGLLSAGFLRSPDQMHITLAGMAVLSQVILVKKAFAVSRSSIEAIRTNEQLKLEAQRRQQAEQEARQARDVALKASSAKSDFLANMSHELRTPMNAVIGFTGALRAGIAGSLNDKQMEYLEDIQNSGEHLLNLISELLDLSKIEAGKFELRYEVVDPAALVESCIRLLGRQAEKGGVTIAAEIPPGLPQLQADPRVAKQLLVNLLSNALKFSPPSGKVRVVAMANKSGAIELSVVDEGAGIAPEDLSRVMLPFEQTDMGKSMEGTGLGLPMVQRIAELHGGEFILESALGEGTAATVSLPAGAVEDVARIRG